MPQTVCDDAPPPSDPKTSVPDTAVADAVSQDAPLVKNPNAPTETPSQARVNKGGSDDQAANHSETHGRATANAEKSVATAITAHESSRLKMSAQEAVDPTSTANSSSEQKLSTQEAAGPTSKPEGKAVSETANTVHEEAVDPTSTANSSSEHKLSTQEAAGPTSEPEGKAVSETANTVNEAINDDVAAPVNPKHGADAVSKEATAADEGAAKIANSDAADIEVNPQSIEGSQSEAQVGAKSPAHGSQEQKTQSKQASCASPITAVVDEVGSGEKDVADEARVQKDAAGEVRMERKAIDDVNAPVPKHDADAVSKDAIPLAPNSENKDDTAADAGASKIGSSAATDIEVNPQSQEGSPSEFQVRAKSPAHENQDQKIHSKSAPCPTPTTAVLNKVEAGKKDVADEARGQKDAAGEARIDRKAAAGQTKIWENPQQASKWNLPAGAFLPPAPLPSYMQNLTPSMANASANEVPKPVASVGVVSIAATKTAEPVSIISPPMAAQQADKELVPAQRLMPPPVSGGPAPPPPPVQSLPAALPLLPGPPALPPLPANRLVLSDSEAAKLVQRWFRGQMRRRRFREILQRAMERRKFLDGRRVLSRRIDMNEREVAEMQRRIVQPRGTRLVERWQAKREAHAAERVQTLWRSLRKKRKMIQMLGEQEKEYAVQKLQSFFRRRRQVQHERHRWEKVLANTCWNRPEEEQLLRYEEEVMAKRRQYVPPYRGKPEPAPTQTFEELRQRAGVLYNEMSVNAALVNKDIMHTLAKRERSREIIQVLEGRNLSLPVPRGVCSAAFLQQAEEKHEQRKSSTLRAMSIGGLPLPPLADLVSDVAIAVESREEETEANEILTALETTLGYDFRLADEK